MPRIVDHEKYSQQLVDRCIALFAESQYGGVTMRAIAKALGVSTGTLYHYFPSKEALFERVVESVSRHEAGLAIRAIPPGLTPDQRVAAVLAYLEANEARILQQYLLLTDFLRTNPGSEVRTVLNATHDRYRDTIAQLLQLADPNDAGAVLVFVRGLILQRFIDGGKTAFSDQIPYLERLIRP